MPRALPKRLALPAALRPAACQHGHPLRWLLDGSEPLGDGQSLAICACAGRREDARNDRHNGSTPCLWRFIPTSTIGAPSRLIPYFPTMSRTAFALAMKLDAQTAQDAQDVA